MHILLTRPLEDCSEMIVKFQSLDHKVSHLSLINVEKVHHDEINFADYGGVIFTSSNAVKNLNVKNLNKKLICFCVGSTTCLLYTSPSPRDLSTSRMPSSA